MNDKVKLIAIDEKTFNPYLKNSDRVLVFTGIEGGANNISEHKAILEKAGVYEEKRLLNGMTQIPGIHKEKYSAHFSISPKESLQSNYPNADIKVVGMAELTEAYKDLVRNKIRIGARGEAEVLEHLGIKQNPGGRKL